MKTIFYRQDLYSVLDIRVCQIIWCPLYRNEESGRENMYSNDVIDATSTPQTTTETSGIFSVATGAKGIIKVHQILEERPTKIQDLKIRNEDQQIPDSFFDQLSNTIYGEDQESGESYKIYLLSTTKSPLENHINPNFFQTQISSGQTPHTSGPKFRSPAKLQGATDNLMAF